MAAVALICMTMTSVALTACGSDDDDNTKTYNYEIFLELKSISWESPIEEDNDVPAEWKNSILNAYKSALGVSSNTFSLNGTQTECDKKVQDACKKAEATVATIKGGSGTVTVKNNTANKTVYTYQVQK